jgi:hypothetical protein
MWNFRRVSNAPPSPPSSAMRPASACFASNSSRTRSRNANGICRPYASSATTRYAEAGGCLVGWLVGLVAVWVVGWVAVCARVRVCHTQRVVLKQRRARRGDPGVWLVHGHPWFASRSPKGVRASPPAPADRSPLKAATELSPSRATARTPAAAASTSVSCAARLVRCCIRGWAACMRHAGEGAMQPPCNPPCKDNSL